MAVYSDLAEMDMEAALILANTEGLSSYNACAIHCRQCAEKYLKHIMAKAYCALSNCITHDELSEIMCTHSLKRLLHYCGKVHKELYDVKEEIDLLNGYYTTVNYPGSDFLYVDKELAIELLKAATSVRNTCGNILRNV